MATAAAISSRRRGSMGIVRGFLGLAEAAPVGRRHAFAPPRNRGCQIGSGWGKLDLSSIQFPQPLADVRGPPCKAGLRRFRGFWVWLGSSTAPRIDAVVDQLALPNRVAPRADWCGTHGAWQGTNHGGVQTPEPIWSASRYSSRLPRLQHASGVATRGRTPDFGRKGTQSNELAT